MTASIEPGLVYRLHMTRGRALNASLGAVSEEAHQSFRHAASIAHQMADIEKEIDALDWGFGITFNAGMIRKSVILARTMLDIGTRNEHLAAKISGHQALGMAYCALGDFENAQHHLESALDTKGQQVDGLNCYPSMSLDYLSYVKYCVGDQQSAKSLCHQAIKSARQESDYATAAALSNSCFTRMLLGDAAMVRDYSEQVIRLARERGQHMFINRGQLYQNLATAWIEQDPEALEQVVEATNALFDSKEEIDLSSLIGMTAEIQIILADYGAAQASLERALTLSEKNEERFYLAELYRLESELILRSAKHTSSSRKEAKHFLDKAMQVATRKMPGAGSPGSISRWKNITRDA